MGPLASASKDLPSQAASAEVKQTSCLALMAASRGPGLILEVYCLVTVNPRQAVYS
jgi:hypothetical protein